MPDNRDQDQDQASQYQHSPSYHGVGQDIAASQDGSGCRKTGQKERGRRGEGTYWV